ncbi:hypothetical protein ACLK17_21210 [Escherichia coli]
MGYAYQAQWCWNFWWDFFVSLGRISVYAASGKHNPIFAICGNRSSDYLFFASVRAVGVPVKYAELKAFQIAFLIPRQRPHHGINRVRFQVFGDFSRIVRLIQARLQRLQRGVGGPDERATWILVFRFDGVNNGFVRGT